MMLSDVCLASDDSKQTLAISAINWITQTVPGSLSLLLSLAIQYKLPTAIWFA